MTEDERDLLVEARESLSAAKGLLRMGYTGYAASRAYYSMFYVAEALLESKGLAFSKHSAVIAAFGQHFAKTGVVPSECHTFLIEAQEVRLKGDYVGSSFVTTVQAATQIERAERFLAEAERLIGSP